MSLVKRTGDAYIAKELNPQQRRITDMRAWDYPKETIVIACHSCNRFGRYPKALLNSQDLHVFAVRRPYQADLCKRIIRLISGGGFRGCLGVFLRKNHTLRAC